MARQIPDLPVMNANEGRDDDVILIRDSSSQTDKKMTVAQLRALIGGVDYDELFPVGSIRILADSADHSSDFGFTWERYAAGKTLVGYNSSDTDFDSIGETGGSKTHNHPLGSNGAAGIRNYGDKTYVVNGADGESLWRMDGTPNSVWVWSHNSDASAGTDLGHTGVRLYGRTEDKTTMPPYITVAFWRRIE